ncbi:MAG: SPASM domain-containing protein [Paludibacteraceae bacterium]|nr:SPASM domain-containing protein [Paludibacteraceae bacterium]MBN2787295.1 SPASM domain-containing protein [Paludibacteraceae bacterium]
MNSSFFNYFSIKKISNCLLVLGCYLISWAFKKAVLVGNPITLSIEPVNYCMLSCPECPAGNGSLTRKAGQMSLFTYSSLIKQAAPYVSYLTLYFQGEPLLHPNFIEFIQVAKENKIYTSSSTNAQLLNDEMAEKIVKSGLNKLIISIDGTTQETYEKYRVGGSLEKAKEGVKAIVKWKKALQLNYPFVELQFLVLKHNEHQLPEIKQLAKELGVNKLSLKTAQINDFERGSDLIPLQKKYARYKKNSDGNFKRKKKICNHCWRAFSGAVITIDGEVLPCSFDKNGEYSFGNIHKESLSKIWHNEKAQRFRQQILTDRKVFKICRNCVM